METERAPLPDADLEALRAAIADGVDGFWALTGEDMIGLAPEGVSESGDVYSGAYVLMDEDYWPRLLALHWPLAQRLFKALGLSPMGNVDPAHDLVYGTSHSREEGVSR